MGFGGGGGGVGGLNNSRDYAKTGHWGTRPAPPPQLPILVKSAILGKQPLTEYQLLFPYHKHIMI